MANELRDRLVVSILNADNYDSFECKLCDKCDDACDCCHAEKIADTILEDGWIRPQWISVKDRLPEEHDKYLCAEYSKMFNQYFIRILYFAKDLYRHDRFAFPDKKDIGGFYESSGEWGMVLIDEVTHWMPLPEPPKAE